MSANCSMSTIIFPYISNLPSTDAIMHISLFCTIGSITTGVFSSCDSISSIMFCSNLSMGFAMYSYVVAEFLAGLTVTIVFLSFFSTFLTLILVSLKTFSAIFKSSIKQCSLFK